MIKYGDWYIIKFQVSEKMKKKASRHLHYFQKLSSSYLQDPSQVPVSSVSHWNQMAFTCWLSRLRSSYSKTITNLRTSFFHHLQTRGANTTAITSPYHFSKQNPFRFTFSNSLLPITLAGSLAIHFQSPPPLCDASLDSPSVHFSLLFFLF